MVEDDEIVALLVADEDEAGVLAMGRRRRESHGAESKQKKHLPHGFSHGAFCHGALGGRSGAGMEPNSTRCACCSSRNWSRSSVVDPGCARAPDLSRSASASF